MKRTQINEAIRSGAHNAYSEAKEEYQDILVEAGMMLERQRKGYVEDRIQQVAKIVSKTGCWQFMHKGEKSVIDLHTIDYQLRDYRVLQAVVWLIRDGYNRLSDADLTTISSEDISCDVRDFLKGVWLLQMLYAYSDGRSPQEQPERKAKERNTTQGQRENINRVLTALVQAGKLSKQGDKYKIETRKTTQREFGFILKWMESKIFYGQSRRVKDFWSQYFTNMDCNKKYQCSDWKLRGEPGRAEVLSPNDKELENILYNINLIENGR